MPDVRKPSLLLLLWLLCRAFTYGRAGGAQQVVDKRLGRAGDHGRGQRPGSPAERERLIDFSRHRLGRVKQRSRRRGDCSQQPRRDLTFGHRTLSGPRQDANEGAQIGGGKVEVAQSARVARHDITASPPARRTADGRARIGDCARQVVHTVVERSRLVDNRVQCSAFCRHDCLRASGRDGSNPICQRPRRRPHPRLGINRKEQLTEDEQLQFRMRWNAILRYWEDVHYQFRLGLYDEVEYSKQKAAWKATFADSVGFVKYWSEVRSLYSPRFAAEIDGLLPPQTTLSPASSHP